MAFVTVLSTQLLHRDFVAAGAVRGAGGVTPVPTRGAA